jgi:hypothetical protein
MGSHAGGDVRLAAGCAKRNLEPVVGIREAIQEVSWEKMRPRQS